ncbi:hypothetical protein FB45DRAFT_888980 [Roridomyces roridus]|uniref:Uncharacterized protein n=1 Tax=Roridomyces roridus TaxID=1738132 RepID=A0AAD7FYZ3_9AGAR|nr:hypothetical protein FB45DRAFT_888980 [Roridomyces roridus]
MSSSSSSSLSSASSASSFSTATPMTSPSQSQSVLPSASDAGGGGSSNSGSMLSSGTNYFFGFLVAFIAFLFIFLALGFLARRRRLRLLHDFILYGPQDDDNSRIAQKEPMLYEPKFVDAPVPPLWADIMPLSTSLVRRDVLQSKEALPLPATTSTPPTSGAALRSFLRLPRKAQVDAGSPTPTLVKVPEALDVAVLINMPQPPGASTRDPDEEEGPPEYLIGTLHLPWKDDDLGVELPTS